MEKTTKILIPYKPFAFITDSECLEELKLVKECIKLDGSPTEYTFIRPNGEVLSYTELPPLYLSDKSFEDNKPLSDNALFESVEIASMFSWAKPTPHRAHSDEKGVYLWVFEKGQAVKWYIHEHCKEIRRIYDSEKSMLINVETDVEMPKSYACPEQVYKYNDYEEVLEDGTKVLHEGLFKYLILTPEQKKLAENLQKALDDAKEGGLFVYYNNDDYCLCALNGIHADFVCCPSDESDMLPFEDDCAHVFNNVNEVYPGNNEWFISIKK